jgi:broad specificity phosphatase PhoE
VRIKESFRTVYLARHGETEWNAAGRWQGHTDVALSARGREQALALAARLRGKGIGRIRASDLSRARETAEIVARAIGLGAPDVDPDLRERSFGIFEGRTRDECALLYPEVWARYQQVLRPTFAVQPLTHIPGAEPHERVVARMTEALRRATAVLGRADEALLIVSHGGSLRVLMASATGRAYPPIGNAGLFRVVVAGDRFEEVEDLGV